jgi:hypothetical protein
MEREGVEESLMNIKVTAMCCLICSTSPILVMTTQILGAAGRYSPPSSLLLLLKAKHYDTPIFS